MEKNVNKLIFAALLAPCISEWSKYNVYQKDQLWRRLLGGSIAMVTRNRKYEEK